MDSEHGFAEWTCDSNGVANSSDQFLELVDVVARIVRQARVGDDPQAIGRLVVAQLAHLHGMSPKVIERDMV